MGLTDGLTGAMKGLGNTGLRAATKGVGKQVEKLLGDKAGALVGQAGGKIAGALVGKLGGALLGAIFGGRSDPDIPFSFWVEIDGIRCTKFREARGLEWKSDVVSFYEGGNHQNKVNLVGPGSFSPLVLKRGYFASQGEFFEMMKATVGLTAGAMKRVSMSIVSCNDQGDEIGRFNFYNAFISKYQGPGFNAMENSIAFEEVQITFDYFDFIPGGAIAGALQGGFGALGKAFK